MKKITAHCVIRNEELWIWYVINSVLDCFDKIIICDTGSEDHTLEILQTIKSDKIEIIKKPKLLGNDFKYNFTKYKNELIDMTKTPWWFLLDGDEIFSTQGLKEMIEKLSQITNNITTLSVRMKYFVESLHRVATIDPIESYKFVRTGAHRWALGYGDILLAEPQPKKEQRLAHWYKQKKWDFECFHLTFLERSKTCDGEEFTYRRKARFSRTIHGQLYRGKIGYNGPYPEVFYRNDVPKIVKKLNHYIPQIYKPKEIFGM